MIKGCLGIFVLFMGAIILSPPYYISIIIMKLCEYLEIKITELIDWCDK